MDWTSYNYNSGKCVIHRGVSKIDCHFKDDKYLTSIEIPDSVTEIASDAFEGCENLSSIIVSENNPTYKSLNNCCLNKNGSILKFGCQNSIIPDSVTVIGNCAFSGHTRLTSIKIPDSVVEIRPSVFKNCTGLTSIKIPKNVAKIGTFAFNGCTKLTSLEIPNSVTTIGELAFAGCTGLRSINIPHSVTKLGVFAFAECSGLTYISFTDGVASWGWLGGPRSAVFYKANPAFVDISIHENSPKNATNILYILRIENFDPSIVTLKVPVGRGFAYRHHPDFKGKFKDILAVISPY